MPDIRSPATGAAPAERSHDVSRGVSSLTGAGVSAPAAFSPVTIVVAGEPVAKGRPRMTRTGRAYTPAKTRQYETYARLVAQQEMQGRRLLEGPLIMTMRVDLAIPSSWSKKKQQAALAGEVLPCVRPDADNFIKGALDSLSGVVFADDKQVVDIHAFKRYAETPKMIVTIEQMRAPA